MPILGHLNGYVAIPRGHWAFEKSSDDLEEKLSVHGGVTYSEKFLTGEKVNPDIWWIGFDCMHFGDFVPGFMGLGISSQGTFRDQTFVKKELKRLVKQLL